MVPTIAAAGAGGMVSLYLLESRRKRAAAGLSAFAKADTEGGVGGAGEAMMSVPLLHWKAHSRWVSSVTWLGRGSGSVPAVCATTSDDGLLKLWDLDAELRNREAMFDSSWLCPQDYWEAEERRNEAWFVHQGTLEATCAEEREDSGCVTMLASAQPHSAGIYGCDTAEGYMLTCSKDGSVSVSQLTGTDIVPVWDRTVSQVRR